MKNLTVIITTLLLFFSCQKDDQPEIVYSVEYGAECTVCAMNVFFENDTIINVIQEGGSPWKLEFTAEQGDQLMIDMTNGYNITDPINCYIKVNGEIVAESSDTCGYNFCNIELKYLLN